MVDLSRVRARAAGPEEHDVGRREAGGLDAHALRNLAGHRRGGSAAQDIRQLRGAGIGLDLVDAPDEPGAVESALRLGAVRRLGRLALAAPDVGVADEPDGGRQDLALPRSQQRKLERGRCVRRPLASASPRARGAGRRSTRPPRGWRGRWVAARDRPGRWDGSCAGRAGARRPRSRSGPVDEAPPRRLRPGRTTRRRSCSSARTRRASSCAIDTVAAGSAASSEAARSARRREC